MSAIVQTLLRANEAEPNRLDFLDKEDLIKLAKSLLSGGVALSFSGKRSALEIGRKVRLVVPSSIATTSRKPSRKYRASASP